MIKIEFWAWVFRKSTLQIRRLSSLFYLTCIKFIFFPNTHVHVRQNKYKTTFVPVKIRLSKSVTPFPS